MSSIIDETPEAEGVEEQLGPTNKLWMGDVSVAQLCETIRKNGKYNYNINLNYSVYS